MKNKEGEIINGIIYGSRNIVNGKWYIGQTTIGLENRRRQHLKAARNNYGHGAFYSAIRKYGADSFEWVVLESNIKTHDELNEREKF